MYFWVGLVCLVMLCTGCATLTTVKERFQSLVCPTCEPVIIKENVTPAPPISNDIDKKILDSERLNKTLPKPRVR